MVGFTLTPKVALIIGFGLFSACIVLGASCLLVKHYYRKHCSKTSKKIKTGRRIRSSYVPLQRDIPAFSIPATLVPFLIQQMSEAERRGSLSADDYQDGRQLLPPTRQSFTVGSRRQNYKDVGHSKSAAKITKTTSVNKKQLSPPDQPRPPHRKNAIYRKHPKSCLGKLEFSVYYDKSFHFLQVHIARGVRISSPEFLSPPDPLVVASLSSEKSQTWEQKTKTVQKSYNPNFNEILEAHRIDPWKLQGSTLKFQLLDDRTCKIIGEAQYSMNDLPVNKWIHKRLSLVAVKVGETDQDSTEGCEGKSSSKRGELLVSVAHNSTDQTLSVGIKSARALQPVSREGKANPYVKLSVNFCGRKLYSRTTKTVRDTLSPNFSECYSFHLLSDKLPQTSLIFKVRDHGKLRDAELGVVHLGYNAVVEKEYKHWDQVIENGHETEQWHELQEWKPVSNTF